MEFSYFDGLGFSVLLSMLAITAAIINFYRKRVTKRELIPNPNTKDEKNDSDRIPTFKESVEVLWTSNTPCFARAKIVLSLHSKPPHTFTYNFTTMAHMFGVKDFHDLRIRDEDTGVTLKFGDIENWHIPMINGKKFTAFVTSQAVMTSGYRIKEIAQLLGSFEKVKQLSRAFYSRVWNKEGDPEFKRAFVGSAGGVEEAADSQGRWLWEMWGGSESTYTEKFGEGTIFRRMMSKHGKSHMTFKNACEWLKVMKCATQEVFMDHDDVINSLFAYWLHFLSFFEYTANERQEFQNILFYDHKC